MKRIVSLLLLCTSLSAVAGTADTLTLFSNAMHRDIKCVVIKPDSYKSKTNRYPVVYLLHGYSGNYTDWITKVPELKSYVDENQVLIVCPDGGYSSWYFDSPLDTTMKYETHVATEVVQTIDQRYRTIPDRKHRAITGLSMGGHGGFFLAWRHSDIFGACGSMSGGVDLNASRQKYDISKRIGDTLTYADNWKKYTVVNMIEKAPKEPLAIIFDCGTEDFYYEVNRNLHQKMLALKIPHDYIERPGQHNWVYWTIAVPYQLLYFKKFFKSNSK